MIATAKSIAGGVPLSAVISRTEVMDAVPGGVIEVLTEEMRLPVLRD